MPEKGKKSLPIYEADHERAKTAASSEKKFLQDWIREAIDLKISGPPTESRARHSSDGSLKQIAKLGSRELSKQDQQLAATLLDWWVTPASDAVHRLVKVALADLLKLRDRLPTPDERK